MYEVGIVMQCGKMQEVAFIFIFYDAEVLRCVHLLN